MPFGRGSSQEKHDYDRGWNASKRFGMSEGSGETPLERADRKGEPRAWYLGYEDYASDKSKYESLK